MRAELAFRTGRGARAFATSATTDAHGRYRLTLPYSTRGSPDSIRPAQGYVVTSDDGAHAMLAIDEAEVVRGLEVPGPTLGPPGEVRGAYPERSSGV